MVEGHARDGEPTGLRRYGPIIRAVGAPYTALIFLARLPMAMTIFGTITYVTSVRGSIADAGLVSAALAVTTAVAQPLFGRWTHAAGQRLPLLIVLPAAVASLVALLLAGTLGAPLWLLVTLGALIGATTMPIGGLSRVRWSTVLRSPREVRTAMSLESMGEEITFVLGPALVGVISAVADPGVALLVNAVGQLLLVPLFALHHLSPAPSGSDPQRRGLSLGRALTYVWAPVAAMVMVGTFFGSVQTSVTAVMTQFGNPSAGGLIYALMGLGSATSALCAVLLPDSVTLRTRLLVAGAAMGVAASALAATGALGSTRATIAVSLLMVLGGLAVGIALVTVYALVGDQAPPAGAAVAMTATSAATTLGVAIGTSLGGRVAQSVGPHEGFLVAAGACVVLVLLAALPHRSPAAPPTRSPGAR